MVSITTPRLILRPLISSDAPAIAAATEESWDDLSQWMRWATDRLKFTDVENCAAYAEACHQKFLRKTDFTFGGFTKAGDFVLITRLALTNDPEIFEFAGYWCCTSMQGKGYMTEAVNAVMRFAFEQLGAKKLIITHAAGNHKTRAVMDRVGFKQTDIRAGVHRLPNGVFVDEYVLSCTNPSDIPAMDVSLRA